MSGCVATDEINARVGNFVGRRGNLRQRVLAPHMLREGATPSATWLYLQEEWCLNGLPATKVQASSKVHIHSEGWRV